MKIRKTLLIAYAINLMLPMMCFSAGISSISIIGFSQNGEYLAYEITYYDDMAGIGHKKVRFVDVDANRYIKTIDLWNEYEDIQNADVAKRKELIKQNLNKYKIVKNKTGSRVYQDSTFLNPINYQKPGAWHKARRNVTFNISADKKNKISYHLILQEYPAETSNCPQLDRKNLKPKIFTLAAMNHETIRILQKDKKLYQSRGCPYACGVHSVYVYKNKIVVFLDSWTRGSEGPNIRKLIVTGILP